ncbi:MAG: hypothetical protein K0R64_2937 [Novosphingobium lindaniclasticum]|jgi:hypothetical protein|nr:hypothetical protein [Novosphingobium lindaniclasticum]
MGLLAYADRGLFAPSKIAAAFRTNSEEVARSAGPVAMPFSPGSVLGRTDPSAARGKGSKVMSKNTPRFGSSLA